MAETSIIDEIEPAVSEEKLSAEVDAEATETPAATGNEMADGEAEAEAAPESNTVPIAIVAEQRQRARDAEEANKELRDKVVRMETLFERFQQEAGPRPYGEQAPEIPDYDEDPLGNLQATNTVLQQQVQALVGNAQQQHAVEEQQGTEAQLMGRYETATRTFMEITPEYADAYKFLAKIRDADLETLGYDDPGQREMVIKREEGIIAGRAMTAGKNPAEVLFNYAKARGFKKGAPGNGEDTTETDYDKLALIDEGQRSSRSIGGPKGGTEGPISLERLSEMNEDDPEFDDAFQEAKRRGLLG